jgi:hypothetical protein
MRFILFVYEILFERNFGKMISSSSLTGFDSSFHSSILAHFWSIFECLTFQAWEAKMREAGEGAKKDQVKVYL